MKQELIRSPGHLIFVRIHPCMVKNTEGENCNIIPVVAHHCTFVKEGGMGLKVGDNYCVPLCVFHHGNLHYNGEKTFWGFCGLTLDEVLDYARYLWEQSQSKKK